MEIDLLDKNEIKNSDDVIKDVEDIIVSSRKVIYQAVDIVLLKRNWLIGKRIYNEINLASREELYGNELIINLSVKLTQKYGKGFDRSNLYFYLKFYTLYKNIFYSASRQSFLTWTHYRYLLKISDTKARNWYENEAIKERWSVRTLKRNIETQYYYRLLSSSNPEPVKEEMIQKNKTNQKETYEHIKNPLVFEFFGWKEIESFRESELETAIINNLQKVLMELGKGYAFIDRQYHIRTDSNNYFVDLVFYNYILKCFVLVDLKVGRVDHKDIGQMDMYVRMFDELIKNESDNPTLGIVLCSETDADIARYSILKGNEQLFATKYKLYLPDEKELKAEIERQKELFELQKKQ